MTWRPWGRIPWSGILTATVLLGVMLSFLAELGFFEPARLALASRNLGRLGALLWPPDTSPDTFENLAEALWETVQMAYVGTLLGALLGLPLAVLATPSLAGRAVAHPVRLVLAFVRTVPSLLWAIVFVILFGLGPLAGVLGLAIYTVGYVGKLYYEALEALDPDVIEAVRATGANRLQLVRHVAIPEAANALVSHLLYAFEYNVRASSILGFVGAGGIGFYLKIYVENFQLQKLTTAILLLLALVVVIDVVSRLIRKRFLVEAQPNATGAAPAPAPEPGGAT